MLRVHMPKFYQTPMQNILLYLFDRLHLSSLIRKVAERF